MKRFCYFIMLPLVSLGGTAYWLSELRAQSPEPRSILEKAIEAHGGAKNIGKARMGRLKGKSEGGVGELFQEETFDLPKRWKKVTSGTAPDGQKRLSFDLMIDGKLWSWDEGKEPQESPNEANAQPFFGSATLLIALMHEKVKLSPLKKTKVNGESAVGLHAGWDRGVADYYFDEKTGLLAQSNSKWESEPGKEFDTKTVYSDYTETDGVKLARRRSTFIKGGRFKEFVLLGNHVVTEITILDTIADEVFALPAKK